ncbi:MAG: LUD domain-containing protein [Burkholderiales bacterium]|nr:LUD domain-containing protein [Burkholderiales bacterium]
MSARDDILGTIRRSLGVTGNERPRVTAVDERLAAAPKGLVPERGNLAGAALFDLFKAQAAATLATLEEVDALDKVPEAVADYLRRGNLPARARVGDALSGLPWAGTALEVTTGASDGRDLVAVNRAFGGVAETGTLALVSGPDSPTTLNFLPDYAIAVLKRSEITGDYETLWARLRERFGKGVMPRTVNWVTGPSRSGDIEQTILLGAHGPRSVHIIVVDD